MEKEKFISVIKANQNLIYKICFTYCPDPEERKDLQQEILLQLWSSFSKFDGRVKISTWIYRVALNTAISYYRQESRFRDRQTRLDASVISISYLDEETDKDENMAILYSFIRELNQLDKALIMLYLDDNKYREIADILGISESNVATKIGRIKLKLKEKFSNS